MEGESRVGEERGEVDESTRMDTERMLTVYIRITDVDRACCPKGVIEHLASRHGRWECEREEVGEGANEKSRTNRSSTSASSFLLLSLSSSGRRSYCFRPKSLVRVPRASFCFAGGS